MSSAVQFYGTDQVIQAATNRKCPAWGLWATRQFMFKYEGDDEKESIDFLEQTLDMIAQNGSTATYTLKFFEKEGNKPIKIKENTPCDGSFNFRLIGEEERQQRNNMYISASPKVLTELQQLREEVANLRAAQNNPATEEEEDEDEKGLMGAVIGVIKDPDLLEQHIRNFHLFKSLFTGIQPAAVGNVKQLGQTKPDIQDPGPAPVTDLSHANNTEMNEEQLIRLGNACDKLYEHDKKIVEHLEKLAAMAANNPVQFQNLIGILDLMA